ncbi:claudin-18-like protein [Pitangus sulphuratus]|nr:claudin-18-like protein [Pitangus sulphuratus]
MSVTICQSMGFVVSALGIGGIIASTCMDQWSTQDLYNNPVTAVFNYQGLWRTCVRESSGFTECRGYFTILGLPENSSFPPEATNILVIGEDPFLRGYVTVQLTVFLDGLTPPGWIFP